MIHVLLNCDRRPAVDFAVLGDEQKVNEALVAWKKAFDHYVGYCLCGDDCGFFDIERLCRNLKNDEGLPLVYLSHYKEPEDVLRAFVTFRGLVASPVRTVEVSVW